VLRWVPIAIALALCGCGSAATKPSPPPDAAQTKVALLKAPKRPGEVIVRGDLSPASHGPFTFDGRYVVRFEQFAPEDPKLDFSGQTPFTASLRTAGSRSDGDELFGAAAASGERELTRRGRFELDVSFGDFPYAVRFTPRK
jgi:hypothetical protein